MTEITHNAKQGHLQVFHKPVYTRLKSAVLSCLDLRVVDIPAHGESVLAPLEIFAMVSGRKLATTICVDPGSPSHAHFKLGGAYSSTGAYPELP
jgi:hypothetical protein